MKNIVFAAGGAVFGVLLETCAYLIKRRGEKMMDLIDDLIEKLGRLKICYDFPDHNDGLHVQTRIVETEMKHAFARVMRRRRAFWHRSFNQMLFLRYERILTLEGGPVDEPCRKALHDYNQTRMMRSQEIAFLIEELEKIYPLV